MSSQTMTRLQRPPPQPTRQPTGVRIALSSQLPRNLEARVGSVRAERSRLDGRLEIAAEPRDARLTVRFVHVVLSTPYSEAARRRGSPRQGRPVHTAIGLALPAPMRSEGYDVRTKAGRIHSVRVRGSRSGD